MDKYEIKDGVGIIPEGTTEIERSAFSHCEELTNVVIPDSVQEIGYDAFFGCSNLTSIVIPSSVIRMIGQPFSGCSALTSISVDENNKVYDSRENCNAIIETASNKLITGCSATVIPDTVTEIGANAFQGSSLASIVVPGSVKIIEEFAFAECKELTNVMLPKSVKTLGQLAFKECPSLKSFSILGPVKKLKDTFWITDPEHPFGYQLPHENMETITLGTGIKELYALYNCTNLKAIYVPAKKSDYYKGILSEQVHHLIVELPEEKKAKKK